MRRRLSLYRFGGTMLLRHDYRLGGGGISLHECLCAPEMAF